MNLDLAVAPEHLAEAAFFDDVDADNIDITRDQLSNFSEFELTRLAMLLVGYFSPSIVLDGDYSDEIVYSLEKAFIGALASLELAEHLALAERWQLDCQTQLGLAKFSEALIQLVELASLAQQRNEAMLYANSGEHIAISDD